MNAESDKVTDTAISSMQLDPAATRVLMMGGAFVVLVIGIVLYGSVTGQAWWQAIAERGWLLALGAIVLIAVALFVFDYTRQKNIAWRQLRGELGQELADVSDRSNFATGRGKIGPFWYYGFRCYASPTGLEIVRMMSFVNKPVSVPWSGVVKVDTYPNLLTGRQGFESDMEAQITLKGESSMVLEVPWLQEYRQLLPKSVRYRAIKLSKK